MLNHAGKAGTERYVQTLIERVDGITPFFAYNEDGLLAERLKELDVPVYRIEMKTRFDFKAARELSRLCKKLNIEIIHTHYLREHYIALLSKFFNPSVTVVYTNHFIIKNDGITRFSNRLLSPFMYKIISVCNAGKKMMIENGMPGEKIQVVFNGIDPGKWQRVKSDKIRKEFNIEDDEILMLCASRFAHDKGHEYLINSVKLLEQKTQCKWRLLLAGDGPLMEKTIKQVEDLGLNERVIFAGFREDIKNLFDGSDIYINSSEHEALSFLIIEALANALPVIATDMGGNSDIICDETKCGILVEYNNPESMASAMTELIKNPALRSELSEYAVKAANGRFNAKTMINQVKNIYKMTGDKK